MDLSKLTPFHVIRYAISTEADDAMQSSHVEYDGEIYAKTLEDLADKLAQLVRETVATWGVVDKTRIDFELDTAKSMLARALQERVNDTFSMRLSKSPGWSYRFVELWGYTIELRYPDGGHVRAPYDDGDSEDRHLFDRVIAARDEAHVQARIRHAEAVDNWKKELTEDTRRAKREQIARLQAELDAE